MVTRPRASRSDPRWQPMSATDSTRHAEPSALSRNEKSPSSLASSLDRFVSLRKTLSEENVEHSDMAANTGVNGEPEPILARARE